MTAAGLDRLRRAAPRAVLAGAGAAVALAGWGVIGSPRLAVAGWLVGLVFWLGPALGALCMLAVHALTGGRWLDALRPVLAPAAMTLPLFGPLALPLLLDPHAVFPWAANPAVVRHPSVVDWYLNWPGFVARGVAALAGWSLFAALLVRGGARRPAVGAAALIFHAVAVTVIGVDWVLSLDPHFRSTVFGAALALGQLLSALALCAVLRPEPPGGAGKAGDLAGLLIAAALGAVYLGFSQFLVSWYGNLPGKAEWFLRREAAPWVWLEGASVLLSAVLPVAALLAGAARRSPRALAAVGAAVLLGQALHVVWLICPPFGPWALLSAALGILAIGGVWVGLAAGPFAARLHAQEAAHGA